MLGWTLPVYGLEIQLQSQLSDARIVSILDLTELARAKVVADAAILVVSLELGMVPEVEELGAELDVAPPVNHFTFKIPCGFIAPPDWKM
jgi:hypothetical protein